MYELICRIRGLIYYMNAGVTIRRKLNCDQKTAGKVSAVGIGCSRRGAGEVGGVTNAFVTLTGKLYLLSTIFLMSLH